MAGLVSAARQVAGAALGLFRRPVADPMQVEGGSVLALQPDYRLLWAYYDNSAFDDILLWARYRGRYGLYRETRLLYNPTRRLVDFYATHVYPGLVTADPTRAPQGTRLALPLADTTTPEQRAALDQLWTWSRWQANKGLLVRYGAAAGSVLLECVDDVDAGRIYLNVTWPGLITYLDLDPTGTILAYTLQYPARDDDNNYYLYRKEVDRQEIRFFRDDEPYDYGEGTAYPNPYGFVPAVWIKHKDLGGNTGMPAIHGSIGKVDQLNSLASHIHDQIHKVVGAPVIVWSDAKIGNLFAPENNQKRPPTSPYDVQDLDRDGVLMLSGPAGGKVDSLAGQLQLAEAATHLTMLATEIAADHPEVVMYDQLRRMSQVTGPAAERLMGDVVENVGEAASNYDAGCASAFAMCLAIGGWRANRGDWGILTAQQQLLRPFDLPLYAAGGLVIRLIPRPLIMISEMEQLELQQLRDSVKAGVPATLTANLREAIPE